MQDRKDPNIGGLIFVRSYEYKNCIYYILYDILYKPKLMDPNNCLSMIFL